MTLIGVLLSTTGAVRGSSIFTMDFSHPITRAALFSPCAQFGHLVNYLSSFYFRSRRQFFGGLSGVVGLDKQADGCTHVRSTAEVGHIKVIKTESKGNKRIRVQILDR